MRTVLVVDDEFGVAEVLQGILEDEGYRVVTAINGKQGLVRLAEANVDLVMVDYMMPIMDGSQMLESMRNDATLSKIPVVMMSSLEEASVREARTDYTSFLRKPFRVASVVAVVTRLLKSSTDQSS